MTDADAVKYGCAAQLCINANDLTVVFDKNGKMVYNKESNENIASIALYNKFVFLEGDTDIIKLDSLTGRTDRADKNTDNNAVMLPRSENEILLCMPGRVRYIEF